MAGLRKLAGQTALYGLSSIVGRFLNYLLVPLYTYKIAAESGGYGVVTNIYAYTAFLLVLLTFGMETTLFRFSNRNDADPKKTFSNALIFVGGIALMFVIICSLFLDNISNALGYSEHPEYIEIMIIVTALDAFQAILFAKLRNELRALKFVFLKLLFIFLNIGLNLFIFLAAPKLYISNPQLMQWYNPEYQVGYIFVINLICTSVITLLFIPELKEVKYGLDAGLLKRMIKYSWPLLLLGIVGILNQVADKICYRFIIPGAEGEVQLGIYGACVKIAMLMTVITQAFRYAYEPFIFGIDKKNEIEGRKTQAETTKYFLIFTLFAFLTVMMYIDIIKYVIQEKYWEGLSVVSIVMMAEVFMGVYFNFSFWYKLSDKTYWGSIISAVGCIVLISINFLFVPKFGYMACAWGGFAGYAICMLMSYFIGQKKVYTPYDVKNMLFYFMIAVLLYLLSSLLTNTNFFGYHFHLFGHEPKLILKLCINTLILIVYIVISAYKEKELLYGAINNAKRIIFKK